MDEVKKEEDFVKDSNFLAGLFQKIVDDCKNGLPLFDEFLNKSQKLQNQLRSTVSVFGSFLDILQKIADSASNTKGSSTDIGICLTRIVIRHRAIESHLKTLTSALTDGCIFPIQTKKDDWKKNVGQLEKEHSKDFKKSRSVLKKRSDTLAKLDKKLKKNKVNNPEMVKLRNSVENDLMLKSRLFEEQEMLAVKEITCQERTHYSTFAACLKPLIGEEFAMLVEVERLHEVVDKINEIITNPYKNLSNSEDILSFVKQSNESFSYSTPSPSGSTLSSKSGSLRSITSSSFSREDLSSRRSSVSSEQESTRKKKLVTKRFSNISSFSQDSGFPSHQDLYERDFSKTNCSSNPKPSNSYTTLIRENNSLYANGTRTNSSTDNYFPVNGYHSPYNVPHIVTGRPPLPNRKPEVPVRSCSLDRSENSCHYSTPRNNSRIPVKCDILLPGPVYMNTNIFKDNSKEAVTPNDEDSKTPTNERVTLLEDKFGSENTSSNGSIASNNSSGYSSLGTNNTVHGNIKDTQKTLTKQKVQTSNKSMDKLIYADNEYSKVSHKPPVAKQPNYRQNKKPIYSNLQTINKMIEVKDHPVVTSDYQCEQDLDKACKTLKKKDIKGSLPQSSSDTMSDHCDTQISVPNIRAEYHL